MSTFGDIERTFADLYGYRWAIGAAVLVFIAAVAAFGYWRGWHQVLWRHRVGFGIAAVPMLAITIWLGWSLGSPLFTNVTVEEEFPFANTAVVPAGMEMADVEDAMAGMAMVDDPVMEESMPAPAAIDAGAALGAGRVEMVIDTAEQKALEEGLTMVRSVTETEMAEMTEMVEMAEVAEMMEMVEKGAQMMEEVIMVAAAAEAVPIKVAEGSFKDADSFHRGSGQATIYQTPDGANLLRLENLDVTNGPALHVILSPHEDPDRSEQVKIEGYVDLGDLKGNRGNQNYEIPAGVDVSVIKSVVIYCKPFAVVFSVATLATP